MIYNVKQYNEAGAPWGMEGRGMFQSFFLDIEGVEGTIKMNKKAGNVPKLGEQDGELIDEGKLDKLGRKIYKFKPIFNPGGAPAQAYQAPKQDAWATPKETVVATQTPSAIPEWFAPYGVMIKELHAYLKAAPVATVEEPFHSPQEEAEEVPGTSLSKKELEDIFGGSMDVINLKADDGTDQSN